MPVTVVIGGQFGSEGKGKVAHEIARMRKVSFAVRVGGSNSGHTVIDHNGVARAFRQLPTAAILPNVTSVIAAGSYVDPVVLMAEIDSTGLTPDNLIIDPSAVLITDEHRQAERDLGLTTNIGSTGSGTGAAVINRIQRDPSLQFVGDDERFKPFIHDVVSILRKGLDGNDRILIEGTQGFGLSLLHSGHYPMVTSRDTTAAAFVSEVGLSPLDVDDIIMVLRAHPIRVAGNSGPLPNEINWETISRESGSPEPIVERTTVTQKVRRIARFDPTVVKAAIQNNRPTQIVMNHLDYLDHSCGASNSPSDVVCSFLNEVEEMIEARIDMIGFGRSSLVACCDHKIAHLSA